MKNIKRFISLTMVVAMLFSLSMVSVNAASVARTATLDASALTGQAGDTIIVDVYLNNTVNLSAIGYRLTFSPSVFEAKTELHGDLYDDEGWEVPQAVDIDWAYDYLNLSNGKKWGLLNFGVNNTVGTISVAGARSNGISSNNNTDNMKIGSFVLTVKADAPAGETTIGLIDATTLDFGESDTAAIAFTPLTFTVAGGEEPEPDTYKVIYNVDGDVASIVDDNEYEEGAEVTVTTQVPSREGYNFLGWSSTEGATTAEYVGGDTFTMGAEDVTLYAVWQKKVYTVTFIADGNPVATLNVEHGGSVDPAQIPAVPAKAGYIGEWQSVDLTNITGNITVEAVYTEVPDGIYVEVGTATIVQGSTGTVDIKFVDLPESAQGVEFEVSYDTNVFTSVTATVNSKFTAEQGTADGEIKIAAVLKENETFDAEQVVATLNLTVALEAPIGETTIQLQNVKYGVEGGSGDAIAIDDVIGGKVTVEQQADPILGAAIEAVEAYEAAPIATLEDIAAAEALEEAARDAVALVQDGSAKDELIARIEAKKALVDAEKVALAKAEALERVNSLNFTYADLQTLEISDAVEANMNSYKLAVSIAQGEKEADLTAEEVAVAVAAANTELSNVANDPSKAGNVYDGAFDIQDAVGVKNHILGKEDFTIAQAIRADMNKDGVINAVDLTEILVNVAKLGD